MSDLEFLALHGLAVKKAGSAAAVADILGSDEAGIDSALEAAVGEGRAMAAKGMFMVTPAGRSWLDERYPEVFADFRAEPRCHGRPTSASSASTASCSRSSPTGR